MNAHRAKALCGLVVLGVGLACQPKPQTSHSVTLMWQPPKIDAGVSIVGYSVYRRTKADSNYTRIASRVPAPPFVDRLVRSGQTYFYAVTAMDKSGRESRLSDNVQAKIP
ncbi:MAG: fibronectin type III domain-containing protein [Terriglobales bacterium]|jgi:fibronectin type 3 domain-containing protein